MNDRTAASALVPISIPALQMNEGELLAVMSNSVYPGAKLESIKLALGYCKSQALDPMTKPVHIVPMSVKVKGENGVKDKYEERDVIMPGIELYRTKAARTGEYAGCSEPDFGPMRSMTFKEKRWIENEDGSRSNKTIESTVEYPDWCKVTAKRLVDGRIVEFTAIEFWVENYATQGRDSDAPNAMWKKRPRGQLAKCAEAQALRKGFPEVGALPTAEEMQGKTLDETGTVIDHDTGKPEAPKVQMPQERLPAETAKPEAPKAETSTDAQDASRPVEGEVMPREAKAANASPPAKKSQLDLIRKKAEQAAIGMSDIAKRFKLPTVDEKTGEVLDPLAGITTETGNAILDFIRDPVGE